MFRSFTIDFNYLSTNAAATAFKVLRHRKANIPTAHNHHTVLCMGGFTKHL